jgi:hypothetical protein
MPVHYYTDTARPTTLAAAITDTQPSFDVTSFVGYPTQYPYTLRIEPGTSNEELVDMDGPPFGSGLTLAPLRGVNGTAGVAHPAGSVVALGWTARDATEASDHQYTQLLLNTGTGIHGLPTGQALLGYDASYTVARPDGQPLSTVSAAALTNLATVNGRSVAPTSTALTGVNGWTNVGSGYRAMRYQGPDPRGLVTVEGYLSGGTLTAGTVLVQGLPVVQQTIIFLATAWLSSTSMTPAYLTLGPAGKISTMLALATGSQVFIQLTYSTTA